MDQQSANRERLWEALESCPIGTDDIRDPQFADVAAQLASDPDTQIAFRRLQHADAAIKAAFADVPVPAGLADRISRRLAEAAPAAMEIGERITGSPAVSPAWAERFSRRRLVFGFAAICAAAALFAAVWIETHAPRHDTPASVLDDAMALFDGDHHPPGALVDQARAAD